MAFLAVDSTRNERSPLPSSLHHKGVLSYQTRTKDKDRRSHITPPAPDSPYAVAARDDTPRSQRRFAGEILVDLVETSQLLELRTAYPWIAQIRPIAGSVHLIEFQEAQKPFAAAEQELLDSGRVRAAEPNFAVLLAQVHGTDDGKIKLESKRLTETDRSQNDKLIRHDACILDSGLQSNLLPLVGQTLNLSSQGQSGDINDVIGHGSLVFGISSGLADDSSRNELKPQICMVKVFEDDGYARLSAILEGLQWAAARSPIINLSFGLYQDSMFLKQSIRDLLRRKLLLVAAAGNDATEAVLYPAAYEGVIAVGSHNAEFQRSEFSNWSERIDFYLPGEEVKAWEDGTSTRTMTGTSASAALLTQLSIKALRQGLSVPEIPEFFRQRSLEQFQEQPHLPETYRRLDSKLAFPSHVPGKRVEVAILRFQEASDILNEPRVSFELAWSDRSQERRLPFSLFVREGSRMERQIPIEINRVQMNGSLRQLALDIDLKAFQILPKDGQELVFELKPRDVWLNGPRMRTVVMRPAAIQQVKLKQLWATPLDFKNKEQDAQISVIVQNRSRDLQGDLSLRLYMIPAVHEGLARTPKQLLGDFPLDEGIDGERSRRFSFRIPPLSFDTDRLSLYAELYQGETFQDSLTKSYRQSSSYQAFPLYAQKVHRYMVEEAIRLLQKQGVFIPDLMNPALQETYRGRVGERNEWPSIGFGDFSLPTGKVEAQDYWDDEVISGLKAFFGIKRLTILDGAHDADAIDIAFGYSFEDVFDSHFWIVDQHDDDGLDSNGSNHHSALTKLRALVYGGGKLRHGAIDHYRRGDKVAAWWFMGHAAHLIGDLTVPSHVNNENAHGTYGDAYHDWMDDGAYTRWTADHPLIAGKGFVDPYSPRHAGDPLRYLAYTSAQLGNSFAWASTLLGTTFGSSGNRLAGGDTPHYEDAMQEIFAAMPARPLLEWHINKDEVKDVWGKCDLVDWIGPTEKVSDCRDRDGHKDRDNTDDNGNDQDGDLSRIGDSNFTYGVRAIAGLIYYFAKETGQIP